MKLRAMPHCRMLCLLYVEKAPEWFCKAVQEALFKLDYGTDYRNAAQGLWDVVTEGFDPKDQELYEEAFDLKKTSGPSGPFSLEE